MKKNIVYVPFIYSGINDFAVLNMKISSAVEDDEKA